MEHIKKNFGFMRLPMKDGRIDLAQTSEMVDTFLDAGFNYFDTAHGYLGGKSETALNTCCRLLLYYRFCIETQAIHLDGWMLKYS